MRVRIVPLLALALLAALGAAWFHMQSGAPGEDAPPDEPGEDDTSESATPLRVRRRRRRRVTTSEASPSASESVSPGQGEDASLPSEHSSALPREDADDTSEATLPLPLSTSA